MDVFSSDFVDPQWKALCDTVNHVKANLDQLDDKTLVWQKEIDQKLDQIRSQLEPMIERLKDTSSTWTTQQHRMPSQNGILPSEAVAQVSHPPGVVAWSEGRGLCEASEKNGGMVAAPIMAHDMQQRHNSEASLEDLLGCSPNPYMPMTETSMATDVELSGAIAGSTPALVEKKSLPYSPTNSPQRKSVPTAVFNSNMVKKLQQQKNKGILPKSAKSGFFGDKKGKKKAESFVLSKKRLAVEDAQTWLSRFTTAKIYEVSVLLLIILNSVFIGWQVQVVAYRVEDSYHNGSAYDIKPPDGFFAIQIVFSLVFVIELALRWIGEGFVEFISYSPDVLWNWFDIATVGSGLVEIVIELCSSDGRVVSSISSIRVLRVLRVVKLLKLIRTYPFFHELRMMVESCLNSLKSYMWCVLVLLLLTYLFAISMTTGACAYLSEDRRVSDGDMSSQRLYDFFGTLDKSMISLFQTIAGGRDWYEFYDVLLLLDFHKKWLYLLYISFTMFAVCNVVAAVFVESAMQSSAHDRELLIREQLKDSQDYCSKMMSVFEEMDEDGTGTISEEEFLSHLDDDRVKAYFNSMKLDVSDAQSLFKLLDVDRSGSVEIMEFIEGCQKLKGESRTLDMHLMRYELHSMRHELHDLCLKFFKYAEVKGVSYLRDMRLASTENLDGTRSSIKALTLRRSASMISAR